MMAEDDDLEVGEIAHHDEEHAPHGFGLKKKNQFELYGEKTLS